MITRHFFKMLFALTGMLLLGILGLIAINEYQKMKGMSDASSEFNSIPNPISTR